MTARRAREILLGVVLAGVTLLAILYGMNEATAAGDGRGAEVPRLLCPLH
jgi:hypothetical protein